MFSETNVAPNYVGFLGFSDARVVKAPAKARTPASRRVEFLGDSITAGYCNLCDTAAAAHVEADHDAEPLSIVAVHPCRVAVLLER